MKVKVKSLSRVRLLATPWTAAYQAPPCMGFSRQDYLKNAGLEEAQAGIKIAGRNINNLRYGDDTTLLVESKEEPKSLLMKVKEESGKSWLKAQRSEN